MQIAFDNTFAHNLEGFYVPWDAEKAPKPKLLKWNASLAGELGGELAALPPTEAAEIFSGNVVPDGALPLAQAYAGHQFGGFSPQLGDGRALLLGEVIDNKGQRRDLQLKGSGRTPFSRGGDGKAPLGPVLREYLMGEAMHALGIPTTRALAAVATGESVFREGALPGAVLTRVAASHIRVGTFQFFAARQDTDKVRKLADYVIERHYPDLKDNASPYLTLFDQVAHAQAHLVAQWMNIGFIHGVMNTDNTTVSGETIDYGPCAFMDTYDPDTVFSSIDEHGRYSFKNQPLIAQWNLARFAEALIGIVADEPDEAVRQLTRSIEMFPTLYTSCWLAGMRKKIGLLNDDDGDLELVNDLLQSLEGEGVDFTLFFRTLADAVDGDEGPVRAQFADTTDFDIWLPRWRARLERDGADASQRVAVMNSVNPVFIPRNHKVEEAITAAVDQDDMAPFERLLAVVTKPFDNDAGDEPYAQPAPVGSLPHRTFCGT